MRGCLLQAATDFRFHALLLRWRVRVARRILGGSMEIEQHYVK
ncbi:hypothetical protein AMP9_2491 [plant metagenome]|uniref:Uncharacterized protein n=1 Tax=plant metagenome TaxID=1297885 RepID=A0A484NTN9_9ZZZZ